ncbi:copper resistance CopC family protein [Gracilibacillus thailandensis]|uniref:LPXTG cell wall anchor domain-containing protein n=1 Tax=Gracilibacillus thailandensis TaxID=563735 RepID=A0A6N7R372_9BACI|nr:copper resistance CopC family protein [Gracilibacillus thailandensis]MRI66766.1 LPXTG cell wall anchor domain-containing protein [Gracilibacillus thailandensis]
MFKRSFFFIIVLLTVLPTIVGAHTHLETSDPEENSVLNEDTGTITLKFESTVQELNEITLTHENGEELQLEEVTHEPADTFVVTLPDSLKDGNYSLFYSIVGEDGHVMEQELAYQFESVEEEKTEEAIDDQEISEEATEETIEEELIETDPAKENEANDATDQENENNTLIVVFAIALVIVAILAILLLRKKKK